MCYLHIYPNDFFLLSGPNTRHICWKTREYVFPEYLVKFYIRVSKRRIKLCCKWFSVDLSHARPITIYTSRLRACLYKFNIIPLLICRYTKFIGLKRKLFHEFGSNRLLAHKITTHENIHNDILLKIYKSSSYGEFRYTYNVSMYNTLIHT